MRQNGFYVSVRKTNIIKVDENVHQLPPDLGPIQEYKVSDYYCPDEWSNDGVFIKVEEGQPMWFDFRSNPECALLCSIQRLNPITGEPSDIESGLTKNPKQNYMSLPRQRWLDGYSKDGKVYQFVATKAGEGLAVSENVLPIHMQDSHALGFAFYEPKNPKPAISNTISNTIYKTAIDNTAIDNLHWYKNPKFSNKYVLRYSSAQPEVTLLDSPRVSGPVGSCSTDMSVNMCNSNIVDDDFLVTENDFLSTENEDHINVDNQIEFSKASMGMGGRIEQSIVNDDNTVDYYKESRSALLVIYLVLPEQFESILKKGLRQDASKRDKYVFSGEVGGKQVPLVIPKMS